MDQEQFNLYASAWSLAALRNNCGNEDLLEGLRQFGDAITDKMKDDLLVIDFLKHISTVCNVEFPQALTNELIKEEQQNG